MSVETFTPTLLQFTQGAASKVKSLVEEEGNPRLKLRVFVTGGGCSGFQYGFTFDDEMADDDTVVEREGVSLVVDPMSFQYLVGAEVRDQEPECLQHLRLRSVVLDLIGSPCITCNAAPCARHCRFCVMACAA